jgi:hypothetical protein
VANARATWNARHGRGARGSMLNLFRGHGSWHAGIR